MTKWKVIQALIFKPVIQMQDQVYEAVKKNMLNRLKGREKKKLQTPGLKHTFVLGEKAFRWNIRSQQRKGGKLDRDFPGHFMITEKKAKL